jgi:sterol desaturase/sphingolipid hydroxylase (fatty acid hydroxylase superfamily)
MSKIISNKDETVSLFQNPILEKLSHVHPITPWLVFLPVIAFLGTKNALMYDASQALICFIGGILIWTYMEYALHRWVFHYEPTSKIGKYIFFILHGVHHAYPLDSTRLVMPPAASIPIASLFMSLFGTHHDWYFIGFISGYLVYDTVHYATHHMPMKSKAGRFLKQYHMKHHFEDEHSAYGVSNPAWDFVFGTIPKYLKK